MGVPLRSNIDCLILVKPKQKIYSQSQHDILRTTESERLYNREVKEKLYNRVPLRKTK